MPLRSKEKRSKIDEPMTMKMRKIPSLVDLCIQTAIDNVRYIGDVGAVEISFLSVILPHCTADQLMHIEDSTEGRDLSSVTDELWKRFYEKQFGEKSVELVIERMKQKKVVFKWRKLYEAKTKEREAFQDKSAQKLKQRYQEELSKKKSRQVQLTLKKPPSSKRSFFAANSSYNVSNTKSNIMKKAKIEYLKSHEAMIRTTIRKNNFQRQTFSPPTQSVSRSRNQNNSIGRNLASTSRQAKPPGRG